MRPEDFRLPLFHEDVSDGYEGDHSAFRFQFSTDICRVDKTAQLKARSGLLYLLHSLSGVIQLIRLNQENEKY